MKKKKKGKKLTTKNKVLLLLAFLVCDFLLIFAIYSVCVETSRFSLENEFSDMLKKDISVDDYDTRNLCFGKYRKVEKAIKSYFIDYSDNVKEIVKITNTKKFKSMFSNKSLSDNKEDLTKLINYSINTKKDMDDLFIECNTMLKEEYLVTYITNLYNDDEITEIFMSFMIGDEGSKYFYKLGESMDQKQKELDTILDNSRDCFYFLVINKDKWFVKDKKIQFSSTTLMNQYNQYIENMKQKKS